MFKLQLVALTPLDVGVENKPVSLKMPIKETHSNHKCSVRHHITAL